jgi:hypothetical protein
VAVDDLIGINSSVNMIIFTHGSIVDFLHFTW